MPLDVIHPEFGTVRFPDGTTEDQVRDAFTRDIPNYVRAQKSGPSARRAQLEEDSRQEAEEQPFSPSDYFSGLSLATKGQAVEDIKRQGFSAMEMLARPVQNATRYFGADSDVADFWSERASEAGKRSREYGELGEAIDPSKTGAVSRLVGSTAVSSSPSILGSVVGAGIAGLAGRAVATGAVVGGAVTGGAQSGADVYQRAKEAYIAQGEDPDVAASKAYLPAALAGATTAALTKAFGATGIEALANGFKPVTVRGVVLEASRQANLEGAEEFSDQIAQGIYERVLYNPKKTLNEIVTEGLIAYGAGGVLGGGVSGIQGVAGLASEAQEERATNRRMRQASETVADLQARAGMDSQGGFMDRAALRQMVEPQLSPTEASSGELTRQAIIREMAAEDAREQARPTTPPPTDPKELARQAIIGRLAQAEAGRRAAGAEARVIEKAIEPVSLENLGAIAWDFMERVPNDPRVPMISRLVERGDFSNLAALFDLRYDESATAMPNRFRHVQLPDAMTRVRRAAGGAIPGLQTGAQVARAQAAEAEQAAQGPASRDVQRKQIAVGLLNQRAASQSEAEWQRSLAQAAAVEGIQREVAGPPGPPPPPPPPPGPEEVSLMFHELIDYEGTNSRDIGSAFIRDLPDTSRPGNIRRLGSMLLLGARESSTQATKTKDTRRKSTKRFLVVRDSEDGEAYLVPGYQDVKTRQAFVMPPGKQSGNGISLGSLLAMRATEDPTMARYTPVAIVRFKNRGTSFPRAFSQPEWDRIYSDAQRYKASMRQSTMSAPVKTEPTTPADDTRAEIEAMMTAKADEGQVRTREEEEAGFEPINIPPSGLAMPDVLRIYNGIKEAGNFKDFVVQHEGLIRELIGKLNWGAYLFYRQLSAADQADRLMDFYERFDPDGFATFTTTTQGRRDAGRSATSATAVGGATRSEVGSATAGVAASARVLAGAPPVIPGSQSQDRGPQAAGVVTLVSPTEAVEVLTSPDSPIDHRVGSVLLAALRNPGIRQAVESLGLRLDLVGSVNGLLAGSREVGYDPEGGYDAATATILLATGAKDPSVGAHELAHHLETLLPTKDRARIAQARLQAIQSQLGRPALDPEVRAFLEAILAQERSSQWFDQQFEEIGPRVAEFYPLINGSEFFAGGFTEQAMARWGANPDQRGVWGRVKAFLRSVADWMRRTVGLSSVQEDLFRRLESGDFDVTVRNGMLFDQRGIHGSLPHVFKKTVDLQEAMNPVHPLTAGQIDQLQELASTQQGLIPQSWAGNVFVLSADRSTPEGVAANRLAPIMDVVFLTSGAPANLASLPRGTEDEIVRSERAANGIQQQVSAVQSLQESIRNDLSVATVQLQKAAVLRQKGDVAKVEARFLEAMMRELTSRYRQQLGNMLVTAPPMASARAATAQVLNAMANRVDEFEQSPVAIGRALRLISVNIPDAVLDTAATSADIVIWVNANTGIFSGQVGAEVFGWMLNPATGSAPLEYSRLVDDLKSLRDIRQKGDQAEQAIGQFRAWFAGPKTPRAVTPEKFARAYSRWWAKQKKLDTYAQTIDREIDKWDTRVRGLLLALEHIDELQKTPEYRAAYDLAAQYGTAVMSGLMLQDPNTFETVIIGPNGDEYRVDLRMEAASEHRNHQTLTNLVGEIEAYLAQPDIDPVRARSYRQIADYVSKFQLNPGLNPEAGGRSKNFIDLPGGVTLGFDLFGALSRRVVGSFVPWQIANTMLIRLGGRLGRELHRAHNAADFIDKQLGSVSSNREHGNEAVKLATLNAVRSHGFEVGPSGIAAWQTEVAEQIISKGQHIGDRNLKVGDIIPISGRTVTSEDMVAVRLMKRHQNENLRVAQRVSSGHPMKMFNPLRIQDRIGTMAITRDSFGGGELTMARVPNRDWGTEFVTKWRAAPSDADRLKLLDEPENFMLAVKGRVSESSPEFGHSGPHKQAYGRVTNLITSGATMPATVSDLTDMIAVELVALGEQPNQVMAKQAATLQLIADITGDVKRFEQSILPDPEPQSMDGVPPALASLVQNRNSFTQARKQLVVPSTWFRYSIGTDQRMGEIRSSIKSIHQLRLIQLWSAMKGVLEQKVKEYDTQVRGLVLGGVPRGKARNTVRRRSRQQFLSGETRLDYEEARDYLRDSTMILSELERYAKDGSDVVESGVVKAGSEVLSLIPASLLSSVSSLGTNTISGPGFAGALMAVRLGRLSGFVTGFKTVGMASRESMRLLASAAERIPWMKRVLNVDLPGWNKIAELIEEMADSHRTRLEAATRLGTIQVPNIRQRIELRRQMPQTGGVVQTDEPASFAAQGIDRVFSTPGIRQALEGWRGTFPGVSDLVANLTFTDLFRSDLVNQVKTAGYAAWEARERSGRPNWQDLSTVGNILTPGELGVSNHSQATALRDTFNPAGVLDWILLDYYQRAKVVPVGQRHTVPFLSEGDEAAVLLEYLKAVNLPTDSNRAYLFRGRGASGLVKRGIFMFMGYAAQIADQLSLILMRHSKDVGNKEAIRQVMMVFGTLLVAIVIGLFNLEIFTRLRQFIEGEAPTRATLANVIGTGDPKAWAELAGVSMVSMIPYSGELVARMFGNGTAGRPIFDPTAMIPIANIVNSGYDTLTRIFQTGDAYYPLMDFAKKWAPPVRVALNAFGVAEADRASRAAGRALSTAAPSSMEQRRFSGRGAGTQTAMTPIVRDLVAAAYDGDAAAVAAAYKRAVDEKRSQGVPDAEEAVLSQLQGQVPARRIFGRLPTESEEQAIYSRMRPGQQADYDRSKAAFDLIARTVGGKIQVVQPPSVERPTFGGASRTRRGTRSFSRSTRSTRTRSRRRSMFGRTRSRSSSSRRSRRRRVTVRA